MIKSKFALRLFLSIISIWIPILGSYYSTYLWDSLFPRIVWPSGYSEAHPMACISGVLTLGLLSIIPVFSWNFTFSKPGASWIGKILPDFVESKKKVCSNGQCRASIEGFEHSDDCNDRTYQPESHGWQ